MRVVYPFTKRDPEITAGAPPNAEWWDVSGDPHAYWRLMRDVWADGEAFVVIEHDVVCRPDVIESFESCPCDWGTFPYSDMCHWECQEAWADMLGCTRFSADLIAAVPDAVASIPEDLRLWNNLCDHIAGDKVNGTPSPLRPGSVRAAGFSHHWHFPAVEHTHVIAKSTTLEDQ